MINNQRDARWTNIRVGSGEQTLGQVGCTVSVIGNILGLTPPEVNEALKRVGGFAGGNLVIWAKIEEAFPGVKVKRVWVYNNDDVLANIPNVIVEVPANPIGGRGSHWVRYIGNHQLEDPWTGIVRPTSDFPNPTGYCVIIPPNPAKTTQPIAQEPFHFNDQTLIPVGGEWGTMELQAIRSTLSDQKKKIISLADQEVKIEEEVHSLQTQVESLKTPPKTVFSTPTVVYTTPNGSTKTTAPLSFFDWIKSLLR